MGKLRNTKQSIDELKAQFGAVDDQKLRLSLAAMANDISAQTRLLIYETYNDPELNSIYRAIRASGKYQKGTKDKSYRKIISYPNGYVLDFIKAVMIPMYGERWWKNRKALRHELIRPWHVVNGL